MSEETSVDKAETSGANRSVVRPPTQREVGQPRIVTSSRFIQQQRRTETDMPRWLCVADHMYEDDAIYAAIDRTNEKVLKALYTGKFVAGPSNSSASQAAADFLNYNIRNMSFGSWLEAMNSSNTDIVYGWSFLNIVTETRNHGPYAGMRCLKKLAPRTQRSLYGWVWDKNFREVTGFVQRPNLLKNRDPKLGDFNQNIGINQLVNTFNYAQNYPYIRREQLMHFRYNPVDNNPQGDSPLLHCYDAWVEKNLVQEYEIIGVTKDLAGALVVRVPSELIERANDPSTYPAEAAEYDQLQKDAGDLHAGRSAYIVLASDVDPNTRAREYDVDFKGIDGGGKNYNTQDIIDRKNKAIFNTFGAGFVLLGQDSQGSYALSASQTGTHGFFVEKALNYKIDVINNQLATRLLLANNIALDYNDMPVFEAGVIDEVSLDELGKFVQRAASVNKLTPEMYKHYAKLSGAPIEGIDDLDFLGDAGQSRAGEGMGTSGTGSTSQSNSDTNMDNKSFITKQFVHDGDRIINTQTDKVVKLQDVDQETGEYKES